MQFTRNGLLDEFRDDALSKPTNISTQQIKRIIQTHTASAFYHIKLLLSPWIRLV